MNNAIVLKGDRNLSGFSINMLLTGIRRMKKEIVLKRTWTSEERRFDTPLTQLNVNHHIRQLIIEIRGARREIDWRKSKDLYKLKDVRKYWAAHQEEL